MSRMLERILALHGKKVLRKSALNIRGGAGVFERVMRGRAIRTAVEIGTYRGVSAAEMSQFCERVVTIDLKRGKLELLGEKFDRRAFWNSLGVHNIELQLVSDNDEKRRLLNALDFDFAFIDGAHDPSVADDFDMVKKCGRVLFHDYDSRGRPELDYVFDFVNTLQPARVEVLDIFALWTA